MLLAISLFGCNAKIRALNNKTLNFGLLDSKNVERVIDKRSQGHISEHFYYNFGLGVSIFLEGSFIQNYTTYRAKKWYGYVFWGEESDGTIFNNEKSTGLPVLTTVLPVSHVFNYICFLRFLSLVVMLKSRL